MEFHKICILGLGYIGLPTACTFATHGLDVVGVDTNPAVLGTLQGGGLHIEEAGLSALLDQAVAAGRLRFQAAPEPADAFLIAVPTPFYGEKQADLGAVRAAAAAIVPHLRPGNLVILESTSPPATTCQIVAPILEQSGLRAGGEGGFRLAYSPERVLPGQILRELVENARVIGGVDPASAQAGADLYRRFVRGQIVQTDATTAEMVKLMENTYRDVNIAIANEFARLAERFGIDVWQAIEIANLHPRVQILNPGPGVGGHCISVDPWFLVEAAPDLTPLIRTARQVNDAQPERVVARLRAALGGELVGRRLAVLGLAYKPDVDDLRESPAVEVALQLAQAGARVTACEPHKPEAPLPGVTVTASLGAALAGAEAVIVLVRHEAFSGLTPDQVTARLVLDAVNLLDPGEWAAAGVTLVRLGVG